MEIKSKYVMTILLGMLIVLSGTLGYYLALALNQSITIKPNSPASTASYVVFTNGTAVYAQNGTTGQIDFISTNASYVILRAMSSLTNGGEIFIRAGTYWIDTTLTVPYAGIFFEGEGHGVSIQHGVTILKQANNANLTNIIDCNAKPNCHFVEIFVDGNGAHNQVNANGIIFNSEDGSIENSGFNYCRGIGVYVSGAHAAFIKNVYAEADNTGFCIYGGGTYGTSFIQCYTASDTAYGYRIQGSVHACTFTDCVSQDDPQQAFAIQSLSSGSWPYGNDFVGCQVYEANAGNGYNGFLLQGAQNNTFSACTVGNIGQKANNTYSAFDLQAYNGVNSIFNIFTGCRCYSTATNKPRYGYCEEDANQDYNTVTSCDFADCATANIKVQGAHSIVRNDLLGGLPTENSGLAASCVNSTWIAHGLAGTPNTITMIIDGSNYINSTSYLLEPTVIAENSTMFQIGFLIYNNGTITAVDSTNEKPISWTATYKP